MVLEHLTLQKGRLGAFVLWLKPLIWSKKCSAGAFLGLRRLDSGAMPQLREYDSNGELQVQAHCLSKTLQNVNTHASHQRAKVGQLIQRSHTAMVAYKTHTPHEYVSRSTKTSKQLLYYY